MNLLNNGLILIFLIILIVLDLSKVDKTSVHYRLSILGITLSVSLGLHTFPYHEAGSVAYLFYCISSFFCWLTPFFYLSFILDLTALRRPPYFIWFFVLPVPLAVFSTYLFYFHSVALIVLILLCAVIIFGISLFWMSKWIYAATDERARRDGQWMLMVYSIFILGVLISLVNSLKGLFWILAIWYFITYLAVNHLKIFQQLTNFENQLILNNVFDIVLILDEEGKIIRLNRRGYQIIGASSLSIQGNGIERIIIHSELNRDTRKEWLERFGWLDNGLGAGRSPSIDAFIRTTTGEEIPVDLRIICLSDLGKKISGYIVSATDMRITHQLMKEISDREYSVRELALSESKFSRMFIFNPTGILIVNLETLKITDANPSIEEILECESSALIGKTLADVGFALDDMTVDIFIEKIVMEGTVSEFGATITLGPEKIRKCRLSAVSFDLNRKGNILLSVADVTQRERMSDALMRKQKVETIGLLAGGIAHDFNNILAVILGHIGLAKMRTVDDHARMPLDKAEQACLRAREMTGQLLAFSRGGKPIVAQCNTRSVIMDSAMIAVHDTSIACLFDIEKDIWPIKADKIQISQVISNLVGNAVHAMNKSGIIEIHAVNRDLKTIPKKQRPLSLDSKPMPLGLYVEIKVCDQGPGISDAVRAKMFDPFFTTKEKGTGLGLSIVYSVVQNHFGTITIKSQQGEGTTFSILLPAYFESAKTENEIACSLLPRKLKVLLLDDNPLVRETATNLLLSFDFEVVETATGEGAVQIYRESLGTSNSFDICILDLKVPGGISGTECAKQILALDANAVLLVSSGYCDDPVLSHFKDYGFKGVIAKPYTRDELRQVLSKILVF